MHGVAGDHLLGQERYTSDCHRDQAGQRSPEGVVREMSPVDDTRDRVIRLETEMAALSKQLAGAVRKVDEMHAILLQAKGARWAILGMASLGGFIAAKLSIFLPWSIK